MRFIVFNLLLVQCHAELVWTNDCRASLALDTDNCPDANVCDHGNLLQTELDRNDYQYLEFHADNMDLLETYAMSSFDTNKLFARMDDTGNETVTSFGLVKGVTGEHSGFWAICPETGTFESGLSGDAQISSACYWSATQPSQKGLPSVIDFVNSTDDVMTTASIICEGGKSWLVAWLKRRVIPNIISYSSWLTAIGA